MPPKSAPISAWETSSEGHPADVSLQELAHLGQHLAHCGALRGPLDLFLAGAGWLQILVADHVATVALFVILLIGGISLVR